MSKALWFSVALLFCSALEAEALICNKCTKFKIGFGCVSKERSRICYAAPGQKCKVIESFLEGTIRGIFTQGCTKSINECDLKVFSETVGTMETKCCDDRSLCNRL